MLTRETIRKMTQDTTFKRGLQIYYSKNRVTEFNVTEQRGTGRRAMMVRDMVTARVRLSAAENCKVRLEYDRDSELLITSSCDCLAFTNGGGVCKHCVAVLLKYADWRVKQGLYTRPEGNYSKIQADAAPAAAGNAAADADGASDATGGTTADSVDPAPAPAPVEVYVPKELTTPMMKNLLEKRTRTRTAPVTEPAVHGRVRIEPVLHLSPSGDRVEFRIGADRMYVMKDTGKFKELMATGQSHSYGKNLTFTHTMDSIAPESRGIARFIMSHAGPPALGVVAPAASRLLVIDGGFCKAY
ncbi:MAG: SWIM zinc finger family protein, partial [Firmicutes bacterium]|nr:SWIM zinc finger family protein [Bacillota bacterium]